MVRLLNSWRESPEVPASWRPVRPPGAIVKVNVKNKEVLSLLRRALPGRWQKVYHKGSDGSEVHYFQHVSGKVAFVKHRKR
jgi:hypothetical protein